MKLSIAEQGGGGIIMRNEKRTTSFSTNWTTRDMALVAGSGLFLGALAARRNPGSVRRFTSQVTGGVTQGLQWKNQNLYRLPVKRFTRDSEGFGPLLSAAAKTFSGNHTAGTVSTRDPAKATFKMIGENIPHVVDFVERLHKEEGDGTPLCVQKLLATSETGGYDPHTYCMLTSFDARRASPEARDICELIGNCSDVPTASIEGILKKTADHFPNNQGNRMFISDPTPEYGIMPKQIQIGNGDIVDIIGRYGFDIPRPDGSITRGALYHFATGDRHSLHGSLFHMVWMSKGRVYIYRLGVGEAIKLQGAGRGLYDEINNEEGPPTWFVADINMAREVMGPEVFEELLGGSHSVPGLTAEEFNRTSWEFKHEVGKAGWLSRTIGKDYVFPWARAVQDKIMRDY
jgi:hypothetical protein